MPISSHLDPKVTLCKRRSLPHRSTRTNRPPRGCLFGSDGATMRGVGLFGPIGTLIASHAGAPCRCVRYCVENWTGEGQCGCRCGQSIGALCCDRVVLGLGHGPTCKGLTARAYLQGPDYKGLTTKAPAGISERSATWTSTHRANMHNIVNYHTEFRQISVSTYRANPNTLEKASKTPCERR